MLLVFVFGVSGFGYIIPATFLPVMGRALVPDPLLFGWSWPLFGVAGAVAPLMTVGGRACSATDASGWRVIW